MGPARVGRWSGARAGCKKVGGWWRGCGAKGAVRASLQRQVLGDPHVRLGEDAAAPVGVEKQSPDKAPGDIGGAGWKRYDDPVEKAFKLRICLKTLLEKAFLE